MFDEFEKERQVWDKLDDETAKQHAKFEIYRLLGASRTVIGAYRQSLGLSLDDESVKAVPGAWKTWFKDYRWAERAEAWDAAERRRQDALRQAEVDRVLSNGYAQMHKRVEALDRWARKLEAQMESMFPAVSNDPEDDPAAPFDPNAIRPAWKPEQVFDAQAIKQIFSEFRGALDDLAKERGDRKVKTEMSGPEGAPIDLAVKSALEKVYGDSAATSK